MDMTDKIKKTEVLEKHIIGENGISYTLGEDGLYYPDIRLPEGTHYEIGRYGRMRGGVSERTSQIIIHGTAVKWKTK